MSDLKVIPLGRRTRTDLAEHLDTMAKRVRAGLVEDVVMFYDDKGTGQYHYEATCTKERAVALTAMAHSQALVLMRED